MNKDIVKEMKKFEGEMVEIEIYNNVINTKSRFITEFIFKQTSDRIGCKVKNSISFPSVLVADAVYYKDKIWDVFENTTGYVKIRKYSINKLKINGKSYKIIKTIINPLDYCSFDCYNQIR